MKSKILKYIKQWEQNCYFDGIPDEAPLRLEQLNKVPSYKQIAIAILKNDYSLKTLGLDSFTSNYYHELKKIELSARKNYSIQLKLKL